MATKRKTTTPGAPEETQAEQLEQTAQDIDTNTQTEAIESDDQVDNSALVPAEQFDAVAAELEATKAKLAALESKQSEQRLAGVNSAAQKVAQLEAQPIVRGKPVLTEHGWTTE